MISKNTSEKKKDKFMLAHSINIHSTNIYPKMCLGYNHELNRNNYPAGVLELRRKDLSLSEGQEPGLFHSALNTQCPGCIHWCLIVIPELMNNVIIEY